MYWLLRLLSALVGALSEGLVAWIGDTSGALWFHVLRYRRGVILENLARAFPSLSVVERRALGLNAAQHLVRSLLELLRIPRYTREGLEKIVELRGGEHLHAAYAGGRGFIVLTGHLGSFELSAGAIAARLLPSKMNLVVKSFGAGFDRFLSELRTRAALHLIRDRRTMPEILRALKRGEGVVFVLDQNATRDQGVFVDFFGQPASTMAALALIVRRTGVPVVPVEIWRAADGKHVLEAHAPLSAQTSGDATVELTQRYTRFIEDAIRRHPAQWLWTHKRWRTQKKD